MASDVERPYEVDDGSLIERIRAEIRMEQAVRVHAILWTLHWLLSGAARGQPQYWGWMGLYLAHIQPVVLQLPPDLTTNIEQALDELRTYLASGPPAKR
jgi:hypothetical protein